MGKTPFVVVGIDPGNRICGYAAIAVHGRVLKLAAAGVWRPNPDQPSHYRLMFLADEFAKLLTVVVPRVVAIERAWVGAHAIVGIRLGEARGAILAATARAGVADVYDIAPMRAKKAATSSGPAEKEHVQRAVRARLGIKDSVDLPLDASDAIAVAIAGLGKWQEEQLEAHLPRPLRRAAVIRSKAAALETG